MRNASQCHIDLGLKEPPIGSRAKNTYTFGACRYIWKHSGSFVCVVASVLAPTVTGSRTGTWNNGSMCGIAGHVAPHKPEGVSRTVAGMTAAMARRGPDSEGLSLWPGVALGHRRLAIIDLSETGHQPMLSDDGQIGVVFNGCIYNFLELRQELEARGHRFRSQCDTETLVRGYQEWGIDALVGRLHGMFAFAVWDQGRRTLTLARDRLGVKPLVYCARNGEIAFASTLGALRQAGFGSEMNPEAVLDVLEYGWVADHRSIFQGFSKLPPATIAEWRNGAVSERRYWHLSERDENSRISFEDAVAETERLLLEAVKCRLISDVPLGLLLSGGIDSTLICWAMRQLDAGITAFTVRAPGDPSDESEAASQIARRIGIAHQIVDMPRTGFSLDELVDAYSEPFCCQSAQAMLWVARAAKERATVLLTGDGGDDAYFGYPFFWNAWKAQVLARKLPEAAAQGWRAASRFLPSGGPAKRLKNFLGYATDGLAGHVRAHDGLPYYAKYDIPGERLLGRELPERRLAASLASGRRLLSDVFQYHLRMHFTSEFMPKVDGGCMYYGIEARAPLLDQKLWEYAAAVPPQVHFHQGRPKSVLREIVKRRVGADVAFRKKQGFTVPVEQWLAGRWSGMLNQLREETILEKEGWVRRGALREPIEKALRSQRAPIQLWRLLVLNHWLEKNAYALDTPAGSPAPLLAT